MTVVVPTYRFVCTMPKKSGIEKDAVQNVWHFIAPSGNPTTQDFLNMMTVYKAFLDELRPSLASSLSATGIGQLCEFFKLTAERPPPGTGLGPPVFSGNIQFTSPPTGIGYPSEVCTCVTLDGTVITDAEEGAGNTRPASRKRNRKYIGPLSAATGGAAATTEEARVNTSWRQLLTNAVINQLVNAAIAKGWSLTGFSPTNWQTFPVKNVWVDDAFDIQRRRGEIATSRTNVPSPAAVDAFLAAHKREGHIINVDEFGGLQFASG